jgi:hypothetical protein
MADKFEKLQQFVRKNEHLKNLKMVSLNANFKEVLENQQYWADPGHLNRAGGIKNSVKLQKIISSE